METPRTSTHRDFWLAQARRTSRRVNSAWWLETTTAPLLVASVVGAAAIPLVRRQFPQLETTLLIAAIGGLVLLIALLSWLFASRRFERLETSLVRIEASMGLHNSLSSAHAGVGPWPEPATRPHAGLHWHWPRLVIPPVAALALLTAGLLLPVSSGTHERHTPDEPQAWLKLDSQLDQLQQDEIVDDAYLEEMRQRLEELRSQEEEQWFSHSSLEATDSLAKSHKSETDRLERDLDKADNALQALEKNAGSMSKADQAKLSAEFDQALDSMQNGSMKPNPALLEQMKQLDPSNLGKLSPEQLAQLRENLRKHREGLRQNSGQGEGDDWSDELLDGEDGQNGGNGNKNGDGDSPYGKGGVNRGPGHAPGVLGEEKDGLQTGELTPLEAKDLSNALPGDLLQLQDGEHEVDLAPSRLTEGGGSRSTGSGGDRVWQDSLDPDEQRTLKRFYE